MMKEFVVVVSMMLMSIASMITFAIKDLFGLTCSFIDTTIDIALLLTATILFIHVVHFCIKMGDELE